MCRTQHSYACVPFITWSIESKHGRVYPVTPTIEIRNASRRSAELCDHLQTEWRSPQEKQARGDRLLAPLSGLK